MKAVKIFLAVIFIVAISFGVKAQDKYEYATVVLWVKSSSKSIVATSIADKYTEQEVIRTMSDRDYSQLMPIINKMGSEGWEAYSNTVVGNTVTYFLRKRKS